LADRYGVYFQYYYDVGWIGFIFICVYRYIRTKKSAGGFLLLYIYDIKLKTKQDFNKIKRSFYYHLAKLDLNEELRVTKSTILVPDDKERAMDRFFHDFKKKTKNIVVYKAFTHHIEELE